VTVTYLVRGTFIAGIGELIAELGGDTEALLRAHGVDPAATADWDRFIRYADSAAVLGDAARLLDCPDFGMQLARRQSLQTLGPIGVIFRNAETVEDAIDGVCRFLHNFAPMDTARFVRVNRAGVYSFDTIVHNDFDRYQMVEKALALAMKAFVMLLGSDFVPMRVTFRHRRIASTDRYQDVFGRIPEFEAQYNSIHLPLLSLRRPILDRDAAALALAQNYLTRVRTDLAVADHVRGVTRRLLVVNQASLAEVARAMSLHPRVVQRRLADEGTTFDQVRDDVRRNMAWELSATGIQVSQIARALGYSEQSSYTRACRRWYGESPHQLKVRLRGTLPGAPPT
jgi:AraC-like DNA-binding protein